MPVIPFIPLIAAGVGGGLGLLGAKKGADASKQAAQTAATSPTSLAEADLIKHQTAVGKFGFDKAQELLPQTKGAIDLPFEHFKSILSGDPKEFNKVLAGSNQAVDQQTQNARQNISTFAPRGAIAGQVSKLATQNAQAKQGNYFQAYTNALSGAQGSATQYTNLFNSLLSGGANAGVPALNALTSLSGFQTQKDIASQQLNAQALQGLGTGLGQLLTSLILNRGATGASRTNTIGGDTSTTHAGTGEGHG